MRRTRGRRRVCDPLTPLTHTPPPTHTHLRAEKVLLQHDKPLHVGAAAPHLKHLPTYLKNPGLIREKNSVSRARYCLLLPRLPAA